MDQYVNDILNSTPGDTEAVTVQPDGRWSIQRDPETTTNRNSNPTPSDDDDDDDDDLVEIAGEKPEIRPKVETLTPHSVRTPPLSSREESSGPRSNKRPREDVIDLTFSDDEAPAPKQSRLPASSSLASTGRPPERFRFQLPPPGPSPDYERYNSTF